GFPPGPAARHPPGEECRRGVRGTCNYPSRERGLLPPPLWGRGGEGVVVVARGVSTDSDPHPQPLPTRGRGVHQACTAIMLHTANKRDRAISYENTSSLTPACAGRRAWRRTG